MTDQQTIYQRSILHALLMLLSFSSTASADAGPKPVLRGTVNIVLANANGIVVLTDSNQISKSPSTGQLFTVREPAQKLFRLDDRTVCTIAGFGSLPLPGYPELISSAAGVLDRYERQLQSSGGTHSFTEKLTSLEFLFKELLLAVGNLQHLDPAHLGDLEFELILVGYDIDGTAKIGKLVLAPNLSPNGVVEPVAKQLTEQTVGQELIYEKAGIGGAAVENILAYPAQLAEEPEIGRYARAKAADHGSSLIPAEMEALAKSLARHSALVNTIYVGNFQKMLPVGGRNQIAILGNRAVQEVDQATLSFEPRRLDMSPFSIIVGSRITATGNLRMLIENRQPGRLFLFLKSSFRGGRVLLAGVYYFEDEFSDATFYYDGGVLGFDPSNRVTDCVLSLGPHVDRRSAAIRELIARFPWKTVQ
jgi:hypothetical protein